MPRRRIEPPLRWTFDQVYQAISDQPLKQTPELQTSGGVPFVAQVRLTRDGRHFISLPHHNRIYKEDWGYQTNNMGNDGQRIGHYSVPLDKWVGALQTKDPSLIHPEP